MSSPLFARVSSVEPQWVLPSRIYTTIPKNLHHWLLDKESLTQKLVALSDHAFRVEVVQQSIQKPLASETQRLGLNYHRWALVREVILYGKNTPWVYARTVIPLLSLKGPLKRLRYLGNRSLGSALFADPRIVRGPVELANIGTDYVPRFISARQGESSSVGIQPAWGRRSAFTLENKSLLVTEVFLESLLSITQ